MKRLLPYIIVLLLSFGSVRFLATPGYFPMHDDTQPARVIAMGKALRNGQFPVRWVGDLGYGYGYPIYNFYAPLPYYVGGGLYALGVDALTATKLMFAIGTLFAGITMYFVASWAFGCAGGIVAAAAYMYAPYHAVQIYIRGSVGEYWAAAFLPLVLYGFIRVMKARSRVRGVGIGAIGLAGVILSHTIFGYLAVGFVAGGIVLYWAYRAWKKSFDMRLFLIHVCTLIVALDLSAFFWLPAMFEMRLTDVAKTVGGTADVRSHFVCLPQLWDSPWGYGGSAPGCLDGMSFKLGKAGVILFGASAIAWAVSAVARATWPWTGIGIILAVVSVFGMTEASKVVWDSVPYADFVQYPWRLLSFALVGIAFVSGYIVRVAGKFRPVVTIAVVAILIASSAKLFAGQYAASATAKQFESADDLRYRVSKISDEYLPPGIPKPIDVSGYVRQTVGGDGVAVKTVAETETYGRYELSGKQGDRVRINRAYFAGWEYRIDGKTVTPDVERSLPSVVLSNNTATLEMRLTDTPVRLFGNMLSLCTVFLLPLAFYGKKNIA